MLELGAFENFGFEILGVRFQPIYLVAIYFLKSFKYDRKELILISLLFFHCLVVGDLKSIGALILIIFWIKFFSAYNLKSKFKFIWIIYLLVAYELVFERYIFSDFFSFRTFSSTSYDNRLTLTFSEPSFTGVYLSVLAIIMYFKNQKIHLWILFTLVLLTKSVGGISLLILSFFFILKKKRIFVTFLFIPFIILLGERIKRELTGFGDLDAYNSIATRLNTFIVFFDYFQSNGLNSLIGIGLGNLDTYLINKYWFLRTEFALGNFANGFLAIIMSFGICSIAFFILLRKYSFNNKIFLFILFALLLNGNLNSYILWFPFVVNDLLKGITQNNYLIKSV